MAVSQVCISRKLSGRGQLEPGGDPATQGTRLTRAFPARNACPEGFFLAVTGFCFYVLCRILGTACVSEQAGVRAWP